jgi:hypothetical protein
MFRIIAMNESVNICVSQSAGQAAADSPARLPRTSLRNAPSDYFIIIILYFFLYSEAHPT